MQQIGLIFIKKWIRNLDFQTHLCHALYVISIVYKNNNIHYPFRSLKPLAKGFLSIFSFVILKGTRKKKTHNQ